MSRRARGPTILDGRPEVGYVGFWKRALATLVDCVLLVVLLTPVLLAVRARVSQGATDASLLPGPIDLLIELVVPAVLVITCWRFWGATPGKMLLGAKIVDEKTHAKPRLSQCITRYAGYFPATLLFGLGILAVAFDRHKQGWHDRMARTVVLSTRPEP